MSDLNLWKRNAQIADQHDGGQGPATKGRHAPQAGYLGPGSDEPGVPLSYYFRLLFWRRYIVVAIVAICLVGASVANSFLTPIYEATATLEVEPELPTGALTASWLYDDLAKSNAIYHEILGPYTRFENDEHISEQVARKLTITHPAGSDLVLIGYRAPNPNVAAQVANSTAQSLLEYIGNARARLLSNRAAVLKRQIEGLQAHIEASESSLRKLDREKRVRLKRGSRRRAPSRGGVKADTAHKFAAAAEAQTASDINTLVSRQQQLKREIEGDKLALGWITRDICEIEVLAETQGTPIRLAEPARAPSQPVFPNKRLNLIFAFLFSVVMAVGLIIFSDSAGRNGQLSTASVEGTPVSGGVNPVSSDSTVRL